MEKKATLASRLKEVLTEGEWVTGTNFKAQIEKLSWQQATHTVAELNTIADLTFHIRYYLKGVGDVLDGGPLKIHDQYSFDYMGVEEEEDWQQLRNDFLQEADRFISLVEQMPEAQLSAPFVEEKYGSWERNINVMIEHVYYHLGQVVLIRKLMGE
ncbi:DinB family protein [Persicobacter diffluens]|uniref:DinB-like domain-containing protein n=1 Tax=Persicobacter diffluens TaxID=981 RepID=A0AAN4VX02_9BACT|nr:hypothetical protein PEDI_11230 [Persicobacter diffluens]